MAFRQHTSAQLHPLPDGGFQQDPACPEIVNPMGNADLPPDEEKKLRRSIVEKAVKALQTEIEEQRILC